jgi:mono/diheme cytochrome c family protein
MGISVLDHLHGEIGESCMDGFSRRATSVYLVLGVSSLVIAAAFSPRGIATVAAGSDTAPTAAQVEFFEKRIRPLLSDHCYDCHSATTKQSGGLRLDDRDALLTGGKDGPAVIPGNPEESLLMQRVLEKDDIKRRMPKGEDNPLSPEEIADLRTWIKQGAFWPAGSPTASADQPAPAKHVKLAAYPRPATPEQLAYFEKTVRPIFANRCYNCHSDAFKEAGGLRVDIGIAIFSGGKDGPVIVPGHPEKSLLIDKIKEVDPKKRMPQESPALPAEEIAILENWIKDGAAWPDETEKLPPTPAHIAASYVKLRAKHWAWQPLTDPAVPSVANSSWPATDIDRFILAKLEEKKLAPVNDADPATLIRRLTYDLTGLPPTPPEVKAFHQDHSALAYTQLVDRLLSSPQYGERWGRHWLDVARYAESSGPSRNLPYPNAWRYRDYVIDAVNRDVPYDRFIQEQLAGDQLPAATPSEHDRLITATGFLALGPKDLNQRFSARYKIDNVNDQIDTVTRATMALTVSCARCHDHKYDPIPTTDYYALAGIFTSTVDAAGLKSGMGGSSLDYYAPKLLSYLSTASAPTIPKEEIEKLKAETAAAKKEFDAIKDTLEGNTLGPDGKPVYERFEKKYNRLNEDLTLISDLGEHGYGVHSVREGVVGDTSVRIRGVEERHGPTVPRGYLSVVTVPDAPKIPGAHSGRLELAQWITSPANPLTPRVYVNRVWAHLFDAGIVSTVDNFGSRGDEPSNPQLLDYLAREFMRNGWSTKKLIREIVLSRAYRLGSNIPAGYREIDPSNRLVWRHSPRRLEAEEIRDSILASAGRLQLTHPNGSPSMKVRMIEIQDDGPVVNSLLEAADRSTYRSIYLPLLRGETPRSLAAFNPVIQTLVTGQRDATTVATQALFMLNSPFVQEQSLYLADSLLAGSHQSDTTRIRRAYELILSRDPSPQETKKVQAFLSRYKDSYSKSHLTASSSPAHLVQASDPPSDITAGIVRADDEADTPKNTPEPAIQPENSKQAAWASFVQSLYASAEFEFVR